MLDAVSVVWAMKAQRSAKAI